MTRKINYQPDPDGDYDDNHFVCPYCNREHNGYDNSEGMNSEDDESEIECKCGGVFEIWRTWHFHYHARPKTSPPRYKHSDDEVEP
jgi:hypothetical protein